MKKTICIFSALLLILSAATACSRQKNEPYRMTKPEDYTGETHFTTSVQMTVGTEVSSTRMGTDKKNYEINYVDKNGNAVKTEYYVNGSLKYYYAVSAADEFGNSVRYGYYDADGNLFATVEDGYFYDRDGKQISEEMMTYMIQELN